MSDSGARTEVKIYWGFGCVPYESAKINLNLETTGFFSIITGVLGRYPRGYEKLRLLYVGQAFDCDLRERILNLPDETTACFQRHLARRRERDLLITVGAVSTTAEVTQGLFDDIEASLIYVNQPPCNENGKTSYAGRPLRITNLGSHDYLREVSDCG